MTKDVQRPILKTGITLYIVRHGETDWNKASRYQGQRDIPMNDTGRSQARRQGQALKSIPHALDKLDFVASPLSRAVETMQIIRSELGLERDTFRTDDRLAELNYGHWEGQYAADLPKLDPVSLAEKARDPFGWRPRGGESYRDLQDRIEGWLATVQHDAVVVTHGGVSRVMRGALYAIPQSDIPFLDVPQDRVLVVTADGMSWL